MGSLRSKSQHFKDGQTSLHPDDLNSMVDNAKRSITGPGVYNFNDRITVDTYKQLISREVKLFPFKVINEEPDHLICVPHIPEGFPEVVKNEAFASFSPGQHVFVAKPFLLQQTPFSGQTVVYQNGDSVGYVYDPSVYWDRTANVNNNWEESEKQTISPGYFVNDHIWAFYGHTNLYEISLDGTHSATATSSTQLSVDEEFWNSVDVGSRILIRSSSISSTGTGTTEDLIGVEVTGKTESGFLIDVLIRNKDGTVGSMPTGILEVQVSVPIMWEDANVGARRWESKHDYPENTFLRLLEKTPSKGKYYLSEMVISKADSSGNVTWSLPPKPEKRYIYAELTNDAAPNDYTGTIYYGVMTRGSVKTLSNSTYGSIPIYDAFEAGVPPRPRFIEYTSRVKDPVFTEFYPALSYTRNVDSSGSVEWLPTSCLATMANRKYPIIGHLYMALHTDNNLTLGVNKTGKKHAYHTEGTCCDDDLPDAYYGYGVETCPEFYCWDAELQQCVCCAADCCGLECWDEILQRCYICCDSGNYYDPETNNCLPVGTITCAGGVDIPDVLRCTVTVKDVEIWCPGATGQTWTFPMVYGTSGSYTYYNGSYNYPNYDDPLLSLHHSTLEIEACNLVGNGIGFPPVGVVSDTPLLGHNGATGTCLGSQSYSGSFNNQILVSETHRPSPIYIEIDTLFWTVVIDEYP